MALKRPALIFLLSVLTLGQAQASLKLLLDEQGLSAEQVQASRQLLGEALGKLPPRFKQGLDETLTIRWSRDLETEAYGRADRRVLLLNERLLPALTDGSAATTQTGRPHGTQRQEMLATVLHELTHFYDREQVWTPDERQQIIACSQLASTKTSKELPIRCQGQAGRRYTLSDDPRLLDLAGWQIKVKKHGARERRNDFIARSPDLYELTNPREFVAVNLEYFLLDPSYPCRRPALARYLSEHFGWAPTHEACPGRYPYLNAGSDFDKEPLGWLDPERVYEVDYLFAEGNEKAMSRWGHSMLRLVVCAPGRPRGPDCRLDLQEHLVLSFRAFVNDVQISNWDGLTGSYPSRLFVLPLAQVVEEYTKVELRGLQSVPLKLNRQEITDLLERTAQVHWSYDGHYYFVSNNCAVETFKLLHDSVPRLQQSPLDSITPIGLLDALRIEQVADTSVLDDPREALRLGYRFDSFRERFQAMFTVARDRLHLPQATVEDWLALEPGERRKWFEHADLRASAALLLLEQAALRRELLLAQEELKNRYLGQGDAQDKARFSKAGNALEQLLADSGYLSRPSELLGTSGYGLPQPGEWERLTAESQRRQTHLSNLRETLNTEVRALLDPAIQTGLDQTESNLKQLGDHLRALHKASGGLELH
ncbi:DUF4105 domain-containing protein [Pseudomonas duriflava]|uniref:DUF7844 domain-containing protein n=1 Tax=Pseudomonas duriflava TaxID=459528 RepID=UPI00119F447A|nr:DUF4105 domain-containing protein [Pseudomonas duriflava]